MQCVVCVGCNDLFNFFVAKYRNVFCILESKCLIALSVSIIRSLIQYFGSFF